MKNTHLSKSTSPILTSKTAVRKSKSHAVGERICKHINFDPAQPTIVGAIAGKRSATFRSLIQYMTEAHHQDTGMAGTGSPVLKCVSETYLTQLTQLNDRLGKPIQVLGAIQSMTYLDWVAVEQALTKAELTQLNTQPEGEAGSGVRLNALVPQLSHSYIRVPHYLSRSLSASMLPLGGAVFMGGLASGAAALGDSNGVILAMILATGVISVFGIPSFLYRRTAHCSKAIQEDISDTWEAVFEVKSAADAILLGSIRDVLDSFYQLRETPPDFMSITPKDAMRFIEHYFTYAFEYDSQFLVQVNEFKEDCQNHGILCAEWSTVHVAPLLVQSFQAPSQTDEAAIPPQAALARMPAVQQ